ncbi:MAG: hypothetical protein ACOCV4_04995 [Myxococcota bacterium]
MAPRSRPVLWTLLLWASFGCEVTETDEAPADRRPPARRAEQFRSSPVDRALEAAAEVVRTRGFAKEGDDERGFVVHRETEVMELPMKSGTCYVVLAVGSSALRELDLRVFDSDGGEVARDAHQGSRAAVHHCPPQSGLHYLGVRAVKGNGLYAVRRFRGPTGLDVRVDDLFPEPVAPAEETERP